MPPPLLLRVNGPGEKMGVKGLPLRKKYLVRDFFLICFVKVPTASKLEGGEALMAPPLRKELFFSAPLSPS